VEEWNLPLNPEDLDELAYRSWCITTAKRAGTRSTPRRALRLRSIGGKQSLSAMRCDATRVRITAAFSHDGPFVGAGAELFLGA
jgi:hypothetical protein